MNSFFIKTNPLLKKLFPNYIWDIPNSYNKIYLTFDDGPTPEITTWVLKELEKHNAKATFFCIGENIKRYPELFLDLEKKGHSIGNHTFNHLNGWKTSLVDYIENMDKWEYEVESNSKISNQKSAIKNLFRPPYGKIKPSQSKKLRALGYKIIMWDVLSVDFDEKCTPEKCLENVINNTNSGSIIVFHDSKKAFKNLKYTLPKVLDYFSEKGFKFEAIQ